MAAFSKIATAAATACGLVLAANQATSAEVKLDAELGQSVIAAGKPGRIYLRINLVGIAVEAGERRTPVNVALVIDRSGSMQDEDKIGRARDAAAMAIGRLGADDIASVVAYNHEVDVLLPATKVTGHAEIIRAINKLEADGKTALYAGTEQGLREVEKFLRKDRVNRVILISDGLANVGPETPEELGALGRKAAGLGVSVTTIGLGLGYNEDLMAKLAYASDGNHAFVERGEQLVDIFNKEFGDVLSVVAQEIIIKIDCREGFKPIRALGRDAEISGQSVTARLNQLYGKQQKYLVVELEAPKGFEAGEVAVAGVEVQYTGITSETQKSVRADVGVRVSKTFEEAESSINKKVMTDVTTQLATETNERAVDLRDKGDLAGAKKLLQGNASFLRDAAKSLAAPALEGMASAAESDAGSLEGDWGKTRKAMRANAHKSKVQQSY